MNPAGCSSLQHCLPISFPWEDKKGLDMYQGEAQKEEWVQIRTHSPPNRVWTPPHSDPASPTWTSCDIQGIPTGWVSVEDMDADVHRSSHWGAHAEKSQTESSDVCSKHNM